MTSLVPQSNPLQLFPIATAPKDGRYILLFGPSGYMGTPLRCAVGCFKADYRPFWINHNNDAFTDGGEEPTYWMPIPYGELRSIDTAPKNKKYILLAGASGYNAPLRFEVARYDAEYRPLDPWQNHANDAFSDGGTKPLYWVPLPQIPAVSKTSRDFPEDSHPECLPTEIFMGNTTVVAHQKSRWRTKRLGKIAYNRDGTLNTSNPLLYPWFIQREEVEIEIRKEEAKQRHIGADRIFGYKNMLAQPVTNKKKIPHPECQPDEIYMGNASKALLSNWTSIRFGKTALDANGYEFEEPVGFRPWFIKRAEVEQAIRNNLHDLERVHIYGGLLNQEGLGISLETIKGVTGPERNIQKPRPFGQIPGIGFAVSNDGGKTCVAWRDDVFDALDYLALQNRNGVDDYAVVALQRSEVQAAIEAERIKNGPGNAL